MTIDRRALLKSAAALSAANAMPRLADAMEVEKADYTLRIATGLVELAPDHIVSTTLYNGQFPGPLLRFKEGQRVDVDIHNDTDTPELVHWHGQIIPSRRGRRGRGGLALRAAARQPAYRLRAEARRACAFTTPMSWRAATSTAAPTPAKPGRSTSSRRATRRLRPRGLSGAQGVCAVLQPAAATWRWTCWPALPSRSCKQIGEAADAAAPVKTKGYEVGYDLFSINGKHARPRRADPREAGRARAVPRAQCAAPARFAAWRCPAMCSASSRSTAIRCRRRRTSRCCGSAPPSASPRSSR